MPLLTFIIVLVLIGVGLWAINRFVPMDSKIKNILNVVVVILVIIWILRILGVLDAISSVKV